MAIQADDLRKGRTVSRVALEQLSNQMQTVAWFELERRRAQVSDLSDEQLAGLADEASKRASAAIMDGLGDYHGQSRFEVWAAKFAIHETAVAARQHAAACSAVRRRSSARRRR